MSKWRLLRVAVIAFVAASSFFGPMEPKAELPLDWEALAIIFASIPICLLLVIGLQATNPMTAKVWCKPNWDVNPLNFKDPVQFFHLGAYAALAQGFVTLFRLLFSKAPFYPGALVLVVLGAGSLLGIRLVRLVLNKKYTEST